MRPHDRTRWNFDDIDDKESSFGSSKLAARPGLFRAAGDKNTQLQTGRIKGAKTHVSSVTTWDGQPPPSCGGARRRPRLHQSTPLRLRRQRHRRARVPLPPGELSQVCGRKGNLRPARICRRSPFTSTMLALRIAICALVYIKVGTKALRHRFEITLS